MRVAAGSRFPVALLLVVLLVSSCAPSPSASQTPSATPELSAAEDAAMQTAGDFLAAWASGDWRGLLELIDRNDLAHYTPGGITRLLAAWDTTAGVTGLWAQAGKAVAISLPPGAAAQGTLRAMQVTAWLAFSSTTFGSRSFMR
jgi:hypothetical protein